MKSKVCLNCSKTEFFKVLDDVNPEASSCMTSDGFFLFGTRFQRLLCSYCGCIFSSYEPSDAISEHYINEYDLSDVVQDNFISFNQNLVRKKSQIEDFLLEVLESNKIKSESVLEIACGNGQLLESLKDKLPATELFGVDPNLDAKFAHSRVQYIRDFFDAHLFENKLFDLIIAHSFLNRSAPLPELQNIRKIIKDEGVLSVEIMILEDSMHAPKAWDHSYWFTAGIFERWLKAAGFHILAMRDFKTTRQYICEASDVQLEDIKATASEIIYLEKTFLSFSDFWENLDRKKFLGKYKYIFGGGMFSSLLIGHLNLQNEFEAVIDELRVGEMHGLPIINLDSAQNNPGHVLIFTRDNYLPIIMQKLSDASLDYDVVTVSSN